MEKTKETCSPVHLQTPLSKVDSVSEFNTVIDNYYETVYNYILKLTASYHEAEDLTQETFIRAYTHFNQFRGGSIKAWLFSIARSIFLNKTVRNRYRKLVSLADPSVDISNLQYKITPNKEVIHRHEVSYVWEIARRLHPRQYEILWLYYGEGLTHLEIAQIMGLTFLHVRVLLHRARMALFKELRKDKVGQEILQIYKEL